MNGLVTSVSSRLDGGPIFQQSLRVNTVFRVVAPPAKPLLVYDGDCRFCTLWIKRWQQITGDRVDYLPSQDASIAACFPEIPREQFAIAVQLIEPMGVVFSGARAAFGALATNPSWRWLLRWYESSPLFARMAEGGYGFVAKHRALFSRLTRFCGHEKVE
jgi:predicted DCC family thiol-disulfide oxidoreductase YuxK